MADDIVVKIERRENRGSNDSRRLRKAGKIPVSVYGGGDDTVAGIAEISDLAAILRSDSGQNTIFRVEMEGFDTSDVIFHDRQIDPIRGRLMHADLRRIAKGEKIEVTVQVILIGDPVSLEEEGAVLNQQMREIRILCKPRSIPESIEVDVSALEMNESIHISELEVSDEIEILDEPEAVVASVVFVKELDLEPTPEEELTEPELIGEEDVEGEGSTETEGDKPGAVTTEDDVEKT